MHKTSMKGRTTFLIIIAGTIFAFNTAWSQVSSKYTMKLFGTGMQQMNEYRVSQAPGFGLGGELGKDLGQNWTINAQVAYDYQQLIQDSVLSEWNWAYWEDTYIEWLPGGDYEVINQTLSYMSGDSIYHARFKPEQTLSEVRLSLGFDYQTRRAGSINYFGGLNAGVSIYNRGLKMQEEWTKVFELDPDTTALDTFSGLDYDFQYTLTHFAPAKKGLQPFLTPRLGLRTSLGEKYDLELGWVGIFYLDHLSALETWISETDHNNFPIQSKHQLWVAFRFKY